MAIADTLRRTGRRIRGAITRKPQAVVPVYDPLLAAVRGDRLSLREKTGTRQIAPRGMPTGIDVRNGIWEPFIRPEALVTLTDNVWILGAAVDRVVEEVTKGGYSFQAKFGAKCLVCGAEYDAEPEICDTAGCYSHAFRDPDPAQLKEIESVLERPNWDVAGRVVKTFKDLLKDAVYYNQVIDDWHWEVVRDHTGRVRQLWPMNSEYIRRFEDPALTVGETFCPLCIEENGVDHATYGDIEQCPIHEDRLLRTAWAQIDEQNNIVAVWAALEVLDGNARARGYRIYGRSKVLRAWAMAQIVRWMELNQWGTYSGNQPPDTIVTISDMTQPEVNTMVDEHEKHQSANPEYPEVIYLGLGTGSNLESGGGKLEVHHLMGSMVDMDAAALLRTYTEAVAINLGVSLTAMGVQEAGKLGRPEEVLQVAYDTFEEVQSQKEEFVNGKLVPLFPEVTDWRWAMKPPAAEDEKKKAEEYRAWLEDVQLLQQLGAKAKLDPAVDFGVPIIIEEWPTEPPQPPGMPGMAPGVPPEEAPDSERSEPTVAARGGRAVRGSSGTWRRIHHSGSLETASKGLTPRGIPADEAVRGIRGAEDSLLSTLEQAWEKALRDFRRASGRVPDRREALRLMDSVMEGLRAEFIRAGTEFVAQAYDLGLQEDFPFAAFEGRDEVVVDFIRSQPQFLAGSLSTVITDVSNVLGDEIRKSLEAGFDSGTAIRQATSRLKEELWRVERVVRTETSRIANLARAEQYKKYGAPDDVYVWSVARRSGRPDDRVDPECLALAFEDPATAARLRIWKLDDLRRATNQGFGDFVPHPNCRCTVVRHIET